MRIAQLAPVAESVPPKRYGGTELVVSYLTEELVRRGHDITLFASGDSITTAKLISVCPRSTRTDPSVKEPYAYLTAQMEHAFDMASEFDVVHSHVDHFFFPLARRISTPTVTTLHGRLDLPEVRAVFETFPDINLISVSNSQRSPLPNYRWLATVYHGIPTQDYIFCPQRGDYLAFLGRISPEKGVDTAIEIAKRSGMKLKIAAKVDKDDQDYFHQVIKPQLNDKFVEFLGEIDQKDKSKFLAGAYALVFPIRWPEPFGLVMIEAMACGTPVVAMNWGSVPEIITDGKDGFICDSIDCMVRALGEIGNIDRKECRQHVEKCFSVKAMADSYEAAYKKLLQRD